MGELFNREGASDLRQSVLNTMGRGEELAEAIVKHFDEINSFDFWEDKEIEKLLLRQKEFEISRMGKGLDYPREFTRFTPSSSDSCKRMLFFKHLKAPKDETQMTPQQKRWVKNSTGVHEYRQRDLLYAEKLLKNPAFKVVRIDDPDNPARHGLPSWEKPLETYRIVEHKGAKICVSGMMDGILEYKDGSKIGFEFKTKSNSVADIKALKAPAPSHKKQCIAYSILFGIDEFVITYESVAKDKWGKGILARDDMKAFYIKVTERQRKQLLDKWTEVDENVQTGELPDGDTTKCLFCPFKEVCGTYSGGIAK
ncbi:MULTISPECIES: hypothetical protein [unclassified Exiguobacterium]|uniref:hypothetical protein n=1 Tax=unclassified Exiguobacterium TaxID=2644629 RepID=UPI001BE72364|nr:MULTISPECIES: hypothetical protein [unclassified Exiguobacterium]